MIWKKLIQSLTETFPAAQAPKSVGFLWDNWSQRARDVVAENLNSADGYALKNSWDYDPTSGHFYFVLKRSLAVETLQGKRVRCALEATFHIDPKIDLAQEIDRLLLETASWDFSLTAMRRWQLSEILKTQGKEAFEAATKGGV